MMRLKKDLAIEKPSPKPEITRFKGLGEDRLMNLKISLEKV